MSGSSYSRRRTSGSGAAFSLFPFLAVLLCTMGVLILLLVVISRNIRDKAIASEDAPDAQQQSVENSPENEAPSIDPTLFGLDANASAEEVLEQIRVETDTVTWLTEEIIASQDGTKGQLDDTRARVAEIENAINKLVGELEQIDKLIKSLVLEKEDPSEQLAALREQLEKKKQELASAEEELEKAKEKQGEQSRSYAIVPYRGPNGTYRRPIYIECRNDSVVIQPEGIVLRTTDFLTPDFPENPIEVCVRAVRHYFVGAGQVQRGTEPYPLFLVRPSGIYAYEAARRSLGSWRNDFGYELVDADWNLEFPAPSEELKIRLQEQLALSRTRQAAYLQTEMLQRSAGEKVQYRVGSHGALEAVPGSRESAARQRREILETAERFSGAPTGSGTMGPGFAENATTGLDALGINASTPPARTGSGFGNGNGNAAQPSFGAPGQFAANAPGGGFLNQGTQNGEIPGLGDIPGGDGMEYGNANTGEANAEGVTQHPNAPLPDQIGVSREFSEGRHDSGYADGQDTYSAGTSDSSQNSSQSGRAGQMPNVSLEAMGPAGVPSLTFQQMVRGPKGNQRQKNWAVKSEPLANQSVSRVVKLICEKDRFIFPKQPGLFAAKEIPISRDSMVSAEQLVQELWKYMDTWDSAGERKFWRPILKVQVRPGAEGRYEQLQTDLRDSGLGIERVQ